MALEGTLRDMALTDLFEIFQSGRRSGVLTLSRPDQRGTLVLRDGTLIDAFLTGEPGGALEAAAEEAAVQLFGWEEARFHFAHDAARLARPARIRRSYAELLLESEGRYRRAGPAVDLQSRLRLATAPAQLPPLSVAEWRFLAVFVEGASVGMAAVVVGLSADAAIELSRSLVGRGLLVGAEAPPAPPVSQPAPPARHQAPRAGGQLLHAIMRRVRDL